ncbi:TPA: hypothetical protein TUU97_001157 [Streptococcus equi subsp. zooepidemicus]|nr:hypothetical protein [Streptococcus equi subsp. zooepidemicus]
MIISQEHVSGLNNLFQTIREQLPSVDSKKDYWFVRAQKGLFYKSFLNGGYIAIGWNHITFDDLENLDEDSVKQKIKKFDKNIEKPGSAYNQMMRFTYNLNIGDIVIVPSEAPNDFLVGEITSRPYTESDENIESASNICPFNKRIKVHWMGVIPNRDIDPQLYKLVYSGHTITDANPYKKFINRGLYDAYIDHDHMSVTFKVLQENNIDAFEYTTFLYTLTQMIRIIENDLDASGKKVSLRTNVQSPGPIELIGNPEILIPILAVVILFAGGATFRNLIRRNGANIEFDSKFAKFKAQLNSDGDEAIKKAQANKINAEAIGLLIDKGLSPEFKGANAQLDIKAPETATKILQKELLESQEIDK